MNIFYLLYHEIFYRPLFNGLVFFTKIVPWNDVGIAIIILTILVRIIIFPLTHRSIKTQIKIKNVEPELRKIKENFKDRQKQAQEILKLYKRHGISPYSGFLMLLIQLPILIALYQVFWKGLAFDGNLYYFLAAPENINLKFLGILDITGKSWFLALLTGLSQFLQIKLSFPPKKINRESNNFQDALANSFATQMKYIMPAFIFFIALKFPAAVSLYWTTMNIFAIVHEAIVRKKAKAWTTTPQ